MAQRGAAVAVALALALALAALLGGAESEALESHGRWMHEAREGGAWVMW